jgi:polysaccharide biosynthesis transport protein
MIADARLEAVRAIWNRRKWLVMPAFVFPLAAAVTLILALPTIYRSSATLIVEGQQLPEAFVRPTVTDGIGARLRTISERALSRARLEEMITQFNLYPELGGREPMEEIVGRVRKDIRIAPSAGIPGQHRGGMVAFSVSFQGADAKTVADVANALASFFVDENLKVRERQATDTTEFLETELAHTKRRLDEQERRISQFNWSHIGELPTHLPANIATLDGLNTQLRLNVENQARANDRRSLLALQLSEQTALVRGAAPGASVAPVPGQTPAAVDPSSARLADLRRELAVARTRHTDAHPSVIRMKAEIAELEQHVVPGAAVSAEAAVAEPAEAAVRAAEAAVLNHPQLAHLRQQIADIDLQLKTLKTQEQQLNQDIASHRARVERTPRVEQALQELTRDYGSTKELYLTLLKRYEEARLAGSMEQRQKGEQFRLLDPALPGSEVAAPRRARLLLMALVLCAIPAAVLLVAAEKLDSSFHSVDELRAFTRVPVLTSVPRIVLPSDVRRRRWRIGLGAASGAVALALVVWGGYAVAHGNETLVRVLIAS